LLNLLDAALSIGLQPVRKGSRYVVPCIFHDGDREASLTLYPNQRFFCFGCGAWGNAMDLRMKIPGGRRA
jgi:DNA primase